jgi:hypothetical protein
VPADWQFVWLGSLHRDGGPVATHSLTVAHGLAPWTLHAYLVTLDAAELLARTYEFLLERIASPHARGAYPAPFATQEAIAALPLHLSYRELKSDYFVALVTHFFVRHADRPKWVAFQSTAAVPARQGERTWHDARATELGRAHHTACTCEMWGKPEVCGPQDVSQHLPIMASGLAFQNLCRYRRWALLNWVGTPHLGKAPSCEALRQVIRPAATSDKAPHDCLDDVWPAMPVSTTPKEAVGGGNNGGPGQPDEAVERAKETVQL